MSNQTPAVVADASGADVVTEVADQITACVTLHLEGSRFRSYWADMAARESEEAVAGRAATGIQVVLRRLDSELAREAAVKIAVAREAAKDPPPPPRQAAEAHVLLRTALIQLRTGGLISLKAMCEYLVLASDLKLLTPAAADTYRYLRTHLVSLDYKVVLEIVDRKNNYLPAYFVMNELYKFSHMFSHGQSGSHHRAFSIARLSEAFHKVFDSFKPLARLVSITGRWMLTPVAGHRGLSSSLAWRLDPHNFRYLTKGSLPYSPEALAPQSFLLHVLITQPRGKELISNYVFGRVIMTGRWMLTPVAGHRGLSSSLAWRLDPHNFRYLTKGSLPYSPEALAPQSFLLHVLITQPRGKELISNYVFGRVIMTGRWMLTPVAGHRGLSSSLAWRLDPHNFRYLTKGSLPYSPEALAPQSFLLHVLITQPRGKELISNYVFGRVIMTGRWMLTPVAGHRGLSSSLAWRLDPHNFRYLTKGSLPYSPEALAPQSFLLHVLITQPRGKELISNYVFGRVIMTGRWMLTPVAGHRGLSSSLAWRLDPHNFRYLTKGSLPYSPEALAPQSFLLHVLITQPRGKELISNYVFGRVIMTGRWMLTPVAGHRGLSSSLAWRLDPHNFRYLTKGSLPYSPEALAPQSFLLHVLITQPRGKELISNYVFGRVIMTGRWMLTPVAGHRGLSSSLAWRLDPHNFRYLTKGSLPYSPEALAPQSFLLHVLITQPRGKELISNYVFGRVIMTGRWMLTPVAGHRGLSSSLAWRLDPHNFRYLTKGSLPYSPEALAPQSFLLHVLITQPRRKELISNYVFGRVIMTGRWMLTPVAGHRGLSSSLAWRLDPHNFRYLTKGSLPYSPEALAPQSFLLHVLITQPRGKELISNYVFGRVIMTGRWMLTPVAGHRGLSSSLAWRLDPHNFRYLTKGSLPYSPEALAPQSFLLHVLITQPRGKELISNYVFGRVIMTGRWMLTPVAGHRGLSSSLAWRLDPHNFRYLTKGSLPYSPEALAPQSFLLHVLITQPRGKELISNYVFGRVIMTGRWMLTPVAGRGHRGLSSSLAWRLDPHNFRYLTKGSLPYSPEALAPQSFLLHVLITQPRGKELISNYVFGRAKLQERRNVALSEYVGLALVEGMREAEMAASGTNRPVSAYRWLYLANLFVTSILSQVATFTAILTSLISRLKELPYRQGRDELTWVILQYVSGMGKSGLEPEDGKLVLQLYRMLYTGEEVFLLTENDPQCVKKMAPTCLWIHLKTQGNEAAVPPTIQNQISFLEERYGEKESLREEGGWPLLAVVCNAYSSDVEKEKLVMGMVVDGLESGEAVAGALPAGPPALAQTRPLSMPFLDSLTLHAKIVLSTHMKNILVRQKPLPSPALIESYLRMLSTTVELYDNIKVIIMQIFPSMTNLPNLELVSLICEMVSYRVPPCHLPAIFKAHMTNTMRQALAKPEVGGHPGLELVLTLSLLRLLGWSQSSEFLHIVNRLVREGEALPEDVGRVVVLCLARALGVSAAAADAAAAEPLAARLGIRLWSPSTLALFPKALAAHCEPAQPSQGLTPFSPERMALDRQLQDEYIKWRSLGAEQSLIEHFIRPDAPPVFLCLLFKIVKENQKVPVFAYKILEQLGPKVMAYNMQRLVEHLIRFCIQNQQHQTTLNAMVETLDKLIWTWWVIPVERLVLTVVLALTEEREAMAALWILNWLLGHSKAFSARVQYLVANVSASHWTTQEATEQLKTYYANFPHKSWATMQQELGGAPDLRIFPPLPVYFSHLGLSFLPVADLLIQKMLELPAVTEQLFRELLDTLAPLYKFHPQPGLFIYTTLFYYASTLKDQPWRRRYLVLRLNGTLEGTRPPAWLLSEPFRRELTLTVKEPPALSLSEDYFAELLKRVEDGQRDALSPPTWAELDWRFAEFASPASQALHGAAVELMALPEDPTAVSAALIKHLLHIHLSLVPRESYIRVVNNTGLLLGALPDSFHEPLYSELEEVLESWELAADEGLRLNVWGLDEDLIATARPARLLALAQAFHQHATVGTMQKLPGLFRTRLLPRIRSQAAFLFAVRLILPFLSRIHQDRQELVMKIGVDIYTGVVQVDEAVGPEGELDEDLICDLLYHLKYMFVGDGIKSDIDRLMNQMRPSLREKLKFISPPQTSEIPPPPLHSAVPPPTVPTS